MGIHAIPLILPAAGKSERAGVPKGLRRFRNRHWIEHLCATYRSAGGSTVVLVLGDDRQRYLEALGLGEKTEHHSCNGCNLLLLSNPLPELGPFTSLQSACRCVLSSDAAFAALYLPIDTPLPAPGLLVRLAQALVPGFLAAEPRCQGRGGHPVILSKDFMSALVSLNPCHEEARLDLQMRRLREAGRLACIETDDATVLMNLNTADAWHEYERRETDYHHSSTRRPA